MTWLTGELADPPWPAIRRFRPEVCVHAAWIATPGVYLNAPENRNFLRWSTAFLSDLPEAGASHLIGIGTCLEYAPGHHPLSEANTPLAPETEYARAKHALHVALNGRLAASGATLSWVRLFNPYGPGEHPQRLATSVVHAMARGEVVRLMQPHAIKDYVHVDDVARALLLMCETRWNGDINVGTGCGVQVLDIARIIGRLMGTAHLLPEPEPVAPGTNDRTVADASRLAGLGWRPATELVDGLAGLVQHLT